MLPRGKLWTNLGMFSIFQKKCQKKVKRKSINVCQQLKQNIHSQHPNIIVIALTFYTELLSFSRRRKDIFVLEKRDEYFNHNVSPFFWLWQWLAKWTGFSLRFRFTSSYDQIFIKSFHLSYDRKSVSETTLFYYILSPSGLKIDCQLISGSNATRLIKTLITFVKLFKEQQLYFKY